MRHLLSLLFLFAALLVLVALAPSAAASSDQDNCLAQALGQGLRVLLRNFLGNSSSSKEAAESDEEKERGKQLCTVTQETQDDRDTANGNCAFYCVSKSEGKFGRCTEFAKKFSKSSQNPCVCSNSEKFQGDTLCNVMSARDRNGANEKCATYCATKDKTHGRCLGFEPTATSDSLCVCKNSRIFKDKLFSTFSRCDHTFAGRMDCEQACKASKNPFGVCLKFGIYFFNLI